MNKTVFISGAAAGIGANTARELANRGWIVGAYDISGPVGKNDKSTTENVGAGKIISGYLDVTDFASWTHALDDFLSQAGGKLDALVNNAGILYAGDFIHDGNAQKDSAIVDVNVKGVMYGARAGFPHLKKSKGKMVNMSSAAAVYGTPEMAAYSASKFAVSGLTEGLDLEWDQYGIDVTDIMPLFTSSGMLDGVSTTGTRRMGIRLTPEEVGKAVADEVESPRQRPKGVHHPVGLQSKIVFTISQAPTFIRRFVNAKLTTNRKVKI